MANMSSHTSVTKKKQKEKDIITTDLNAWKQF